MCLCRFVNTTKVVFIIDNFYKVPMRHMYHAYHENFSTVTIFTVYSTTYCLASGALTTPFLSSSSGSLRLVHQCEPTKCFSCYIKLQKLDRPSPNIIQASPLLPTATTTTLPMSMYLFCAILLTSSLLFPLPLFSENLSLYPVKSPSLHHNQSQQ